MNINSISRIRDLNNKQMMFLRKKNYLSIFTLAIFCFSFSLLGKAYSYEIGKVTLKPVTNLATAWDDNITYQANEKKEDCITSAEAGLLLIHMEQTQNIKLLGTVKHQYYFDHTEFENTSQYVNFDFLKEFPGNYTMDIRNSFSHSFDPQDLEEESTRVDGRLMTNRNRFTLNTAKELSSRMSLGLQYKNTLNDPIESEEQNSYYNEFDLGLDYLKSSNTSFYLSPVYKHRKFDPGNSSEGYNIFAGMKQYFTAQLHADIKAGYAYVDSFTQDEHSSFSFYCSLKDEFDENTNMSLSFFKDLNTFSYEEEVLDFWQISADFNKRLSERLNTSFNGFYKQGDYLDSDISENFLGFSISLIYAIKEQTDLFLSYRYSSKTSSEETREYTKNILSLTIKMLFL